jgi:hypothetical protein
VAADLKLAPDGVKIELFDLSPGMHGIRSKLATPDPADVIFDDLQTAGIWKRLAAGGNFMYDVDPTWLLAQRRKYFIKATLTTVDNRVGFGKWILTTACP